MPPSCSSAVTSTSTNPVSANAAFHQCAGQIVRHSDDGQREQAARLLDGTFSDCTQKTVGAIRVLRTSLQRRPA